MNEDREEMAWQKLKEAFPDKHVSLYLHRVRYSNSCKSEIYFWEAYVDYGEELKKGLCWPTCGCWSKGETPIDAVNNLIEDVKSLLKAKEE